jgi:hypothetical protein
MSSELLVTLTPQRGTTVVECERLQQLDVCVRSDLFSMETPALTSSSSASSTSSSENCESEADGQSDMAMMVDQSQESLDTQAIDMAMEQMMMVDNSGNEQVESIQENIRKVCSDFSENESRDYKKLLTDLRMQSELLQQSVSFEEANTFLKSLLLNQKKMARCLTMKETTLSEYVSLIMCSWDLILCLESICKLYCNLRSHDL